MKMNLYGNICQKIIYDNFYDVYNYYIFNF